MSPDDLCGNLLLAALRPQDRALLAPYMDLRECKRGDVLFEVDQDVTHITFPVGQSVAALVIVLRNGRSVETAAVGHEGAIGGVVSQGSLPAFSQAVVQVGGPVLRMPAARLQAIKGESQPLRNLFTRYSDCLLAQVLQSVACNASHPIEERCARWLLALQDRLGGDTLPITHEMLAELLGVQRSYLTRTLRDMQHRGLVKVRRGRITVCNRADMEQAACECHGTIKRHFQRVLGALYSPGGTLLQLRPADVDERARRAS